MTTKVLVFNGFGGSNPVPHKLASWVNHVNPDVALISEIGDLVEPLRGVGKVRVSQHDTPHDVGIYFTGKMDGITRRQLTRFIPRPDTGSPMLWRDRHLIKARRGNETFYSVHANALIGGDSGRWINNEGAEAWKKALKDKIAPMVLADHAEGRHVRLGGDMNFFKSDAPWSPNDFAKRMGLHFRSDRVMWVMWSKGDELVDSATLGIAPGADAHKSLVVKIKKGKR